MNKTRIVSGLSSLLVIATLVGYAEENYSDLEDVNRTAVDNTERVIDSIFFISVRSVNPRLAT